jgi:ribosomal protein S18 acetylase RimI-like enzyme/predicted double-glycine peptidase
MISTDEIIIRPAQLSDLDQLDSLEQRCFNYDQLTRRNFQWMLTKAKASLLVADYKGKILGYVLVLYHAGTSLARLYSMAVDAESRGLGLGKRLLLAAEDAARERNFAYLRLEVRPDNHNAIRLYEACGYRQFEVIPDYYEDHAAARRYEKRILKYVVHGDRRPVPYYAQSTDFTCGPAALMMAMHYLNRGVPLDQRTELQIWREATTIFMTTGHGGCGPHGLALAAHRRGFDVEVFINQREPLFVEGVRSEAKKNVIELVQADFEDQIRRANMRLHRHSFTLAEVVEVLGNGGMPVVLISSYRLNKSKSPHWVTIVDTDNHYVYVHNPEVDEEAGSTAFDCSHVPILKEEFERMAQFGGNRLRAMLVLRTKKG